MPRLRQIIADPKASAIFLAALGQVVMFGAMTAVSRAYSLSALAQYGVVFAVFTILQTVSSLRLEQGIVYERTDEHRSALYLCATLAILPAGLVFGAAGAYYLWTNPDTRPEWPTLALLVIAAAAAGGLGRIHVQMLAAAARVRRVAILNFLRPASIGVCQMASLLFVRDAVTLSAALLASQVIYALCAWALSSVRWHSVAAAFTAGGLRQAMARNRAFPAYSLPQNAIFTVSESAIPLALPLLFPGTVAVALFWLASRVVFAPATIVAESIRPIIYRELAERGEGLFRRALTYSGLIGLPVLLGVIVLLVAGDWLFVQAFGPEWAAANDYALVLGVLVFFNMASLPLVGVLPILHMQRGLLLAELAAFAVRVGLIFGFDWPGPLSLVVAGTLGYMAILSLFFLNVLRRLRRRPPLSEPQR